MSRLAKKPIAIPSGVTIKENDRVLSVTGPKGTLTRALPFDIDVKVEGSEVTVSRVKNNLETRALVGTIASHVKNMLQGVTTGFQKKLIIEGTGYRAKIVGKGLVLSLGYSHDVPMDIPEGITASVKDNELTLDSADKEALGQFAANIRSKRKPEPYKGKGVRYSTEVIARKQGKKGVA